MITIYVRESADSEWVPLETVPEEHAADAAYDLREQYAEENIKAE